MKVNNILFCSIISLLITMFYFVSIEDASAKSRITSSDLSYFESIRVTEANVRTGPGKRYPIKFTLKRRGLPVKILDEYDNWSKVEDFEGETGWVSDNLLTKRKTVLITEDMAVMYKTASLNSKPIFRNEKGVVAKLLKCKRNWCKVELMKEKGWIEKRNIWGYK